MRDNIEEQIARIMADAPSVEDQLAPYREQIAILEKQLATAKTNRKRKAIHRELDKVQRHVSQFGGARNILLRHLRGEQKPEGD
jgi:hypothetical protein